MRSGSRSRTARSTIAAAEPTRSSTGSARWTVRRARAVLSRSATSIRKLDIEASTGAVREDTSGAPYPSRERNVPFGKFRRGLHLVLVEDRDLVGLVGLVRCGQVDLEPFAAFADPLDGLPEEGLEGGEALVDVVLSGVVEPTPLGLGVGDDLLRAAAGL